MSRFIFQLLALSAVARGALALEEGIQLGVGFGGPHGTKYSDLDAVTPGLTVQSLKIRAGERVNGVGIGITDIHGLETPLYHGGDGGDEKLLNLNDGEYITAMEVHWGEKGDHTRVKYIQFATSEGNTVSGGVTTKNIGKDAAPEGYQLGGFYGTSGKELDSVGAIWTKIPKKETVAPVTATPALAADAHFPLPGTVTPPRNVTLTFTAL